MEGVKSLRFQASCVLYDIDRENLKKYKDWNPSPESDVCFHQGGCPVRYMAKSRKHPKCLKNLDAFHHILDFLRKCKYDYLIPMMRVNLEYLNRNSCKSLFIDFAKNGLVTEIKYLIDNKKLHDEFLLHEINYGIKWNHMHNDVYECLINYKRSLFKSIDIFRVVYYERYYLVKLLIEHSVIESVHNLQRAFVFAVDRNCFGIVNLLAEDSRIDVNYNNGEFLTRLCANGSYSFAKRAIEVFKCDPCINNHSALRASITKYSKFTFNYLLSRPEIILDLVTHDDKLKCVISCGQDETQKEFLEKLVKEVNWLKDVLKISD